MRENEQPSSTSPGDRDADLRGRSFVTELFLGELDQTLVTPFPLMPSAERDKVEGMLAALTAVNDELYDPQQAESRRWVGDEVIAALGEAGLLGMAVSPEYGGGGLSQTGALRVGEEFGRIDPSLAIALGTHQSMGVRCIEQFGTEEQKERFLPDLATGRSLAAFALTEPDTGTDAYQLATRAERESDGAWRLNGEKRWIGNGDREVVVCFARSETHGHVALIVTPDMDGFDASFQYDTLGLRANDVRQLKFKNVRVPAENVLGAPGEGFRIAMHGMRGGRMALAAGSIGAGKYVSDLVTARVGSHERFGQRVAQFELVQDKLAWTTLHTYGLEAVTYLTAGMMDAGATDTSLESAIAKIAGTEFVWQAVNHGFRLSGGAAYMQGQPYAKLVRDVRAFPMLAGANSVLRAFVALAGLKVLGDELDDVADLDLLTTPVRSSGLLVDHVRSQPQRRVSPPRLTHVHPLMRPYAERITGQVRDLRAAGEALLRRHGGWVRTKQLQQKRLAHVVMDIFAQVATLSRITAVLEEDGPDATAAQRFVAETYCARAASRVKRNLSHLDANDDDAIRQIAHVGYPQGGDGFSLYGRPSAGS